MLLYGADVWVVSRWDMKRLKRFHKRAVRHMTGEHIKMGCPISFKIGNEIWIIRHEDLYGTKESNFEEVFGGTQG